MIEINDISKVFRTSEVETPRSVFHLAVKR